MSEPFRSLFFVALGSWLAALAYLMAVVRRAPGRAEAWTFVQRYGPAADLAGTWTGALAAGALLLGRRGFDFWWAGALLLVCLMITAGLYDRAVLMPSLEAAWKRLVHEDEAKWEAEWRFLWRMAAWGRRATLLAGALALVCGALS